MANIEKIVLPDNTEYDVKDAGAFHKSAGASELIESDIYIDCSDTTSKSIYFNNSGTTIAKLQKQGSSGALILAKIDSQGSSLAGVDITEQNNAILFADGSDDGVFLRPNGIVTTNGQAWLDKNGQFHGGAKLTTATRSSSTSIPTASWTTVVSQNGLDASGIYVIVGYCTYTPSSNASQEIWYKIYGNNHGSYHTESLKLNNSGSIYIGYTEIITGDTTLSLQLYTNSNVYSGTASSGATLRILRIA